MPAIAEITIGDSYLGLLDGRVPDRFVLVEGRRGTAKTRSILSILVAKGLRDPGRRSLVCRSTRTRLSDTILTTLKDQVLPAFGLPIPTGAPENWHRVPLGNGSELLPMGLDDPQRSQSRECADIYVAEGVELSSVEDITSLAGTLRQAGYGQKQCVVDCNPGPPGHPLNIIAEPFSDKDRHVRTWEQYQRLLEHNWSPSKVEGKWKRIVTQWYDNPGYFDAGAWQWLPAGWEYLQTLNSLTAHYLARWRDGLWVSAEGSVFPEFSESIHVVDDFDIPADWPWYVGWDPGFAHPTAIPWVAVSPAGNLFIADEIYEGGKSIAQHAEEVMRRVRGRTVRAWYGDVHEFFSTRAQSEDSCAMQAKKAGLPYFTPWANQNKQAMVEGWRHVIQNTGKGGNPCVYVLRRCKNTIMEHQSWAFKKNAKGELAGNGDDVYEDRNNHILDCLVGMWATGQIKYHQPGTRRIEVSDNG